MSSARISTTVGRVMVLRAIAGCVQPAPRVPQFNYTDDEYFRPSHEHLECHRFVTPISSGISSPS